MRAFLLFLFLFTCISVHAYKADKLLVIRVSEIGAITVNGDSVGSDDLARYIQERLFKSFMGTGQMHDRIVVQKESANVPDPVTIVVCEEVQEGQRRALLELSLQKFNKKYEQLDSKKQDKIKKQFPVLFQTTFN